MTYVERFEDEWSSYCGMKYGVACTNGTSANLLSLGALGIGKGDEVITTAFSFEGTATPILMLGANPVFIDISEYNMDRSKINYLGNVKAIMPVHLFGRHCGILSNLPIIEDCAQAHGIKPNGLLNTFSFYKTKNLPIGEGGMIVTDDRDLADKMKRLRNHGRQGDFYFGNLRMSEIQAYEGRIGIKTLDCDNDIRKTMAKYYNRELSDKIIKPEFVKDHVWHQYTIRVPEEKRDKLAESLNLKVYYRYTIPERLGLEGIYPIAEQMCNEVLSLPIGPNVDWKKIEEVVEALNCEF